MKSIGSEKKTRTATAGPVSTRNSTRVTRGRDPVEKPVLSTLFAVNGLVTPRAKDPHLKPLCPCGDRPTDPPEADDPEGGAVHLAPEVHSRLPGDPIPLFCRPDRLRQLARRREQQREGEVRCRVREDIGRVADRDSPSRRGLDVDVVDADRVVGDRA